MELSKSMRIDGVLCSEHIDTSGEILDISGCDISSLQDGTGVLNWEHRGDSPADILGKITYAKKIFSEKDCSNEREKIYWDQVKVPFVYGQCELFDGEGHSGALAAAAIIRYYHNRKMPILARFSIEGTTLERNGNVLKRSIARKVACTIKPCNRSAYSGLLFDDGATLKQSEKDLIVGKFLEVSPLLEDPAAKLSDALERLQELSALQKALDENAPLVLEHYSPHADLSVIDPTHHGKGVRDEAWRRKIEYPENWVDRSYYYLAGTQPEAHFTGHHKYTVNLPAEHKIYSIDRDPDQLIPLAAQGDQKGLLSRLEQHIKDKGYSGYRFPSVGGQQDNRFAIFHPLRPMGSEPITKAITAGGMGAAPSQLTGGAALQREDISGAEYKKNRGRVLAAFRDWDRVTPIRKFLKFRLPDASDRYIDKFAGLVDDYKIKKAEELFGNLEKALALTTSIQLFEALMKDEPAQAFGDGTYRVLKKDSPRQIARFHIQDGNFNTLEDHRNCFGPDCQNGPMTDQHSAALRQLQQDGHQIVPETNSDDSNRGELYRMIFPDSGDIVVVRLADNKLMMLDGTEIPEPNVNAILDAVTEGELQMEPMSDDTDVDEGSGQEMHPQLESLGKADSNPSQYKTPEKFSREELIAAVRQDMISEHDAISLYEAHKAASTDEEFNKVLDHVITEEKEHAAMFQRVLNRLDPEQKEKLEEEIKKE